MPLRLNARLKTVNHDAVLNFLLDTDASVDCTSEVSLEMSSHYRKTTAVCVDTPTKRYVRLHEQFFKLFGGIENFEVKLRRICQPHRRIPFHLEEKVRNESKYTT